MLKPLHLLFLTGCFLSIQVHADQLQVGLSNDQQGNPESIRGVLLTHSYEAKQWWWTAERNWFPGIELALNTSVGGWYTPDDTNRNGKAKKHLLTLAIGPQPSLCLYQAPRWSTYLVGSISGAYMSTTQFASQNLGSHLLFQDRIGLRAHLGEHMVTALEYVHYSNANLARPNQGIDIHWLLSVGYRWAAKH